MGGNISHIVAECKETGGTELLVSHNDKIKKTKFKELGESIHSLKVSHEGGYYHLIFFSRKSYPI
jgi:hypothetical protein